MHVYTHAVSYMYTCTCMLCRSVERRNILSIFNLVVKGLIEISMQQGKSLNDEHPQLQQCLIAMEQALKHRLRSESNATYTTPPLSLTHTHTHTVYNV